MRKNSSLVLLCLVLLAPDLAAQNSRPHKNPPPEGRLQKLDPRKGETRKQIPTWIRQLKSPKPKLRRSAARLLAAQGKDSVKAVPVALELLPDAEKVDDLLPLLHLLARVAPWDREGLAAAAKAVGELPLSLNATRQEVLRTQAAMRVPGDNSIIWLRRQLMSGNVYIREAAARCLAARPTEAAAVLKQMKKVLAKPRLNMRMGVLIQPGVRMTLRPDAKGFFRALSEAIFRASRGRDVPSRAWQWLAADPDPALRRAAVAAMGNQPEAAAQNMKFLIARLQDPEANVAREAVVAVGRLGARAGTARPMLEKLASGTDRLTAKLAKDALRRLNQAPTATANKPATKKQKR